MRLDSNNSLVGDKNPVEKISNNGFTSVDETPYIGGKHFSPNNLASEYIIFEKDGCLNIIGNFTREWLYNNLDKLDSDLVNAHNYKTINLWNQIDYGTNSLDKLGVNVTVTREGMNIEGYTGKIEHHNQDLDDELDNINNVDETLTDEDNNSKKDMSGLDIIPDMSDSIGITDKGVEPIKGRKIERKKAKPSLIEKFKNLKTWQKVAIVAGVIAVTGVAVFVVGPQIINGINHLLNPETVETMSAAVNNTASSAGEAANALDYSSIGEGHTVFTNAYDAASNANGVVSNEWFSNNPLDVFNTATNSYMGLTPEQLNDPTFMAELANDPNNAVLFGNSMSDPSGFMGLDDVVQEITKSGMVK